MSQFEKRKTVLILANLLLPIALHANQISHLSQPFIAGGAYHASQGLKPLLLSSKNNGESWKLAQINSDTSQEESKGIVESISCSQAFCAATGAFMLSKMSLIVSIDGGETWTFPKNINLPSSSILQQTKAVACNKNNCVLTGVNLVYSGIKPLLLVSDQTGQNWTSIENITDLPTNIEATSIDAINCTDSVCVATGVLETANTDSPLLLVSNDSGKSWRYIKSISIPTNTTVRAFDKLSCDQQNCAVAGAYTSDSGDKPFVFVSNDYGQNWYPASLPSFTDMKNIELASVNFTQSTLMITGMYESKESYWPLILVSKNNGKSFQQMDNIAGKPHDMIASAITSSYCTESNACTAIGYYLSSADKEFKSMFLTSKNGGNTWTIIQKIENQPARQISFQTLTCHNDFCVAAGENNTNLDSVLPPIAISQNTGASWKFVDNIKGFPEDLTSVEVYALR